RFAPLPLPAEAAGRWRRPWRPGPCRSPSGVWCPRAAAASADRRGPEQLPCGPLLGGSVRRSLHLRKGNIKIYVPKTSLSSPPWPETVLPEPAEETRHHAEVVGKVNELIATGQYGRLFAVVHFASHQWKVTSEDLILIENELDVACGERIRLEKVLLVGADNFTLLGKPLLGKDLVRVEATVIEKTESWPKINMKFKKRKNYRKKKSACGGLPSLSCCWPSDGLCWSTRSFLLQGLH
uniref:Large ribosomal subunit protein bL21m n=1 Tax=Equus caballus TaxID=9796 RepID=A0A9L0TSA0_HORSE